MIMSIRGYFNNAVSKSLYDPSIFSTECPLLKLVSFLVLSSYLIIHTNAESGIFTISAQGHCLKAYVIKNTTASSAVHCMQKCLTEGPQCKSINYRKISQSKGECQLNNNSAACNTLNLIADKEFNYFERSVEGQNAFCLAIHSESTQLLPLSTSTLNSSLAGKSCADLYKKGERKDGIYTIDPDGQGEFKARCDMTTSGGGWTVFQRRVDGSVDFYLGWKNYTEGFGNLSGEFWLGLDKINRLSKSGQNVLRFDLEDFENETRYANYSTFAVANKTDNYTLTVGGYSGDAGDSFARQNGMMFSTKDKDNDRSPGNCASRYEGAWWYNKCHDSNLNARYLRGNHTSRADGVNWDHWRGEYYSLKKTEMKIRPRSF